LDTARHGVLRDSIRQPAELFQSFLLVLGYAAFDVRTAWNGTIEVRRPRRSWGLPADHGSGGKDGEDHLAASTWQNWPSG
jgi:hypothetical protein